MTLNPRTAVSVWEWAGFLADWGSCEDRLAALGFSGLALWKSPTSRTSL